MVETGEVRVHYLRAILWFSIMGGGASVTAETHHVQIRHGAEISGVVEPTFIDVDLSSISRPPEGFVQPMIQVSEGFAVPRLSFDSVFSSPEDPTRGPLPSPGGAIGGDHFIEIANGPGSPRIIVFDKHSGAVQAGPLRVQDLATAECKAYGTGGQVLWDDRANRFIIASTSGMDRVCVYVQSDPEDLIRGGFFEYRFSTGGHLSSAKIGNGADGYYVGAHKSVVLALERDSMLVGEPARIQGFDIEPLFGPFILEWLVPARVNGSLSPSEDLPGLFLRHRDDEITSPESNDPSRDFLEIWEFTANWQQPALSTLRGPMEIGLAEYDSHCNGRFGGDCFPEPFGNMDSIGVDMLHIMPPVSYRDRGAFQSLLANITVDVDGNDHGAVRWFELRRTRESEWSIHQEGTFSPDDTDRWLASAAMDQDGNIFMGYNVVHDANPEVSVGLRYAGRRNDDALGVLTRGEFSLVEGSGISPIPFGYWSRTASATVDPVDDCTFWFNGTYLKDGEIRTRIASTRFEDCGPSRFVLDASRLNHPQVCAPGEIPEVTLSVLGLGGYGEEVDLFLPNLPPGVTATITPDRLLASEPPSTAIAHFSLDASIPAGGLSLVIAGQGLAVDAGILEQTMNLSAVVQTTPPNSVIPLEPAHNAARVHRPTFKWQPVDGAARYRFELARDAGFEQVVRDVTMRLTEFTPDDPLESDTRYFWRVTPENSCGWGPASRVFSFTSAWEICVEDDSLIGQLGETLIVAQQVDQTGILAELQVAVEFQHESVGELTVGIRHDGQEAVLLDRFPCFAEDIDARFADSAAQSVNDTCSNAPAVGGIVRPVQPLSRFVGSGLAGDWTLFVTDLFPGQTGQFERWCLVPTLIDQSVPLSVARIGSGSGWVSSVPNGIQCGPDCEAEFSQGDSVELVAFPEPNSRFAGWGDACSGAGRCQVVMNEPKQVDARFVRMDGDLEGVLETRSP